MMKRRIAEEWERYRQQVVPAGAGPEQQLQGAKLAFYGGASSLFALLNEQVSPGQEVKPEDLRMMDEINQEFKDHVRECEQG